MEKIKGKNKNIIRGEGDDETTGIVGGSITEEEEHDEQDMGWMKWNLLRPNHVYMTLLLSMRLQSQ